MTFCHKWIRGQIWGLFRQNRDNFVSHKLHKSNSFLVTYQIFSSESDFLKLFFTTFAPQNCKK